MAKDKTDTPQADEHITLGPCSLTAAILNALPVKAYAKTGVVLANERIKVKVPFNGLATECTMSVYIQRDALTEEESIEVAKVKLERDTKANEREAKEQHAIQAEKKAAFELGQSSTMNALENIGKLAAGARALTALTK